MKTILALTMALLVAGPVAASAAPKTSPTGNAWSSASAISVVNQPDPTRGSQLNDVAVNANGLAIAAWDQFTYAAGGPYTIGAAVQSGGRWGAPFTISGSTGFSMSPRVAVGSDGTMAVSWTWEDTAFALKRVQVAVKPAGASSWTTTTLAEWVPGGVALTELVPVAIDAAGNVTAVWSQWDGTRHLLKASTLPRYAAWTAPVTVSGANADAISPSLSVNARGDAAVVYCLSPYTSYTSGTNAQIAQRSGADAAGTTAPRCSFTWASWGDGTSLKRRRGSLRRPTGWPAPADSWSSLRVTRSCSLPRSPGRASPRWPTRSSARRPIKRRVSWWPPMRGWR